LVVASEVTFQPLDNIARAVQNLFATVHAPLIVFLIIFFSSNDLVAPKKTQELQNNQTKKILIPLNLV